MIHQTPSRWDRLQMWLINEVPLMFGLWRGYYHATRRAGHGRLFSLRNGYRLMRTARIPR